MLVNEGASGFWSLLARVYKNYDLLKESSNKLLDLVNSIDIIDTAENLEKAEKDNFDSTELRRLFFEAQKEINAILSYSHEMYPHLKNPNMVDSLTSRSQSILISMQAPRDSIMLFLFKIKLELQDFARAANILILNPTKKSIQYAFGIDVGNEWLKIKAYIESHYSNY
jgi:hypothetical protein